MRTEWRVTGMKIRSLSGGWTTETSNWYPTEEMAESVMQVRGGRLQRRQIGDPEDVKVATERQKYKVIATQVSLKWWELSFPELFNGEGLSQANGETTIAAEARDYLAVTLGVEKWSFDVEVEKQGWRDDA